MPKNIKRLINRINNGPLTSLLADERAVTALEYGIIAGVLGLVLIATFQRFGSTLSHLFSTISASV